MSCKRSATVLESIQDILDDISNLCTDSEKSTGSEIGMEKVRKVNNTMSDRAATEKKVSSTSSRISNGYTTQVC